MNGKQSFISPYNNGHKLLIIPKLHTQQQNMFLSKFNILLNLCSCLLMVAMAARDSGLHDIYFPGARGLGIHEVLSS
jgi:hypothetical protein